MYIVATFSLYGYWEFDASIKPYIRMTANPILCGNGHTKLDYFMGVDARLTVNPIYVFLGLPRFCKWNVCAGPLGKEIEVPSGGLLPYNFWFPIVREFKVQGAGFIGCVLMGIAAQAKHGFGSSSSAIGLK